MHNPSVNILNRKHTHRHRNSILSQSVPKTILVTIIQHVWLICPRQFPSWLDDDLQKATEQRRGGRMTSSNLIIAPANTTDEFQHGHQSSSPLFLYFHQRTPVNINRVREKARAMTEAGQM